MVTKVAQIVLIWTTLITEAPPQQPAIVQDEFMMQLEESRIAAYLAGLPEPIPYPTPSEPEPSEPIKPEPVKPKPRTKPDPHPFGPPRPGPILDCIAKHESETSGGYAAVNPSGKYRGRYQVDNSFWLTYGGDSQFAGRMEQAPPAMQDQVALNGFNAKGLAPWPTPSRECAYLL